ncbi:hypothetical protein CMQ_744 [Grosmannia clavigera kw1407]|uniref:DUF3824 domain-containing protein n=1 Tax=Grosmannia clavigera (strain kw1407 / UAMH 11150) TaxID=655863 RepID=F0XC77_GROCL|nr:uncharacterized protein CMQ_744 [Grosmannia clavigera kw1407]EFX03816.1 hypothetical protein CMQ_744 [Grosmannia clavigera kw1407]
MSAHEDGRSEYTASRYYDDRRYQRDPRYVESRDNYAKGQVASRDLVPRYREESDYSVEEIHRDFPPPTYSRDVYRSYEDDRRPRSSKDRDYDRREGKKTRTNSYDDERKRRRMLSNQEKILAAVIGGALAVGGKEIYDRREAQQEGRGIQRNALSSAALGAVGAFAAYQGVDLYNKHATKEEQKTLTAYKGRDSRDVDAYDDNDSDYGSKERKGHKNFLESALAAAGLGGAVKALTGGSTGHRDDSRSRSRSRSGSKSRGKGGGTNKIQKAAMASLIAGATEAFRVAKEPGNWKGEKAKRVLTAAAGAATIDAAHGDKHSKMGIAESVIGGLLGNRIVNGSRRNIEEDRHTGRSRSRSRARSDGGGGGSGGVSGLAALATAGLGALGTKKIMESRERSRSRRRSSADSYDSRNRSPGRSRRSRSRSVVDTARRSLAKLGLGNGPDDDYPTDESPRRKKGSSRHNDRRNSADSYDDDYRYGGARDRDRGEGRSGRYENDDNRSSTRRRSGSRSRRDKGGSRHDSESDLGSSSEDEKRAKKMRAAVATIHAAHNVYQSMEKRQSRQRAVREGRLSTGEAKKLKDQALLRDAASVGIAALGIKGAISELKEAREAHHECKEWKEEKQRRHLRRLEHMQRSQSSGRSGRKARNRASSVPPQAGRYYNDYGSDASDDEPRMVNGSPYAALPAPPVGTEARRPDESNRS